MADHALLVGVGDGAALQRVHGGEGLLHPRLHLREERVVEVHTRDVEAQLLGLVMVQIFAVALPELCFVHKSPLFISVQPVSIAIATAPMTAPSAPSAAAEICSAS